jgi:hypothetical protein
MSVYIQTLVKLIKIKNTNINQLAMCDLTVNNNINSSRCEGVSCMQCPYNWFNHRVTIGTLIREHKFDNPS